MVNPFTEVNWKPDLQEKRTFALSLMIGCPTTAFILVGIGRMLHGAWHFNGPAIFAAAGLIVGAVLWLLPVIARPVYVTVYFVVCCIGIVVSNVLLIVFFYVVITGAALALRLTGRTPLQKGFIRRKESYWKDVDPASDVSQYYRQF